MKYKSLTLILFKNNVTTSHLDFTITELRLDPTYIFYYVHWTRLLATGVIPILFLVSINTAIYVVIRRHSSSTPINTPVVVFHRRKESALSLFETRYANLFSIHLKILLKLKENSFSWKLICVFSNNNLNIIIKEKKF